VHRVLGFTRHLPERGWDCTVVCAGAEDYWITDRSLLDRLNPATEVVRVAGGSALSAWLRVRPKDRGQRSRHVFGVLRQLADWWLVPDPYVGWSSRARAAATRVMRERRFDAVLSSSPPDSVHLAALGLERRGVPWVADFRDPWMGLHRRRPPTAWHAGRHATLEGRVLAGADLVLTAAQSHRDLLERGTPRPRHTVHLPNGFEPAVSGTPSAATDPSFFRVVYTGTLARVHELDTFLDALHDLLARRPEARRRVRVQLVGPFETGYRDRAIALGLAPGIVTFEGPKTHDEARALQASADLLALWKMDGMPATVPGKLYEYLDAGRPLVAVLDDGDEAAALVERAGAARVAPRDRAALASAIERVYAAWREHGRAPDARPAWIDGYTRAALAGRLADELDRLVGGADVRSPVTEGRG
jgi:glycosyltransferase involved in cell wall biosynthesis